MITYNEIDPSAAAWLRNLITAGEIPKGDVDERPIQTLRGSDLAGARQFHTFAGIGGWPLALRLAGWPADREVWTGSCPCQPFSVAGKGAGTSDKRHLWPDFLRLIAERRPATIFGEQVGSKAGIGWLDGVQADLEREGYTCGAVIVGAHSVGAPHIRQRIYWVADRLHAGRAARGSSAGDGSLAGGGGVGGLGDGDGDKDNAERRLAELGRDPLGRDAKAVPEWCACHYSVERPSEVGGLGNGVSNDVGRVSGSPFGAQKESDSRRGEDGLDSLVSGSTGDFGGLADGNIERRWQGSDARDGFVGEDAKRGKEINKTGPDGALSPWSDYRIIPCTDGKARRTGARVFPLAHGLPRSVDAERPWRKGLARSASRSRIGILKGSGNAIVPWLAAEFIRATMDVLGIKC